MIFSCTYYNARKFILTYLLVLSIASSAKYKRRMKNKPYTRFYTFVSVFYFEQHLNIGLWAISWFSHEWKEGYANIHRTYKIHFTYMYVNWVRGQIYLYEHRTYVGHITLHRNIARSRMNSWWKWKCKGEWRQYAYLLDNFRLNYFNLPRRFPTCIYFF